jgi:hypothetical protein
MKGVSRMETDTNNERLRRAISDAIVDACETLATHCEFTPDELEDGQGWAEMAASEEEHEDGQDIAEGMAQKEGRGYARKPFDPALRVGSARCYAMMIDRFSQRREAFLAAPTLTAKLVVLGVQVDDPKPLADPVAVLESSARGDFADSQARRLQ